MEQIYTPKQDYKVLVRCFTYNQSKYIEDALNGFAMQQTNFPFVCLVVDDCSTDGEQEVIKGWMEHECDMEKAEYVEIELSNIILVPHKTNTNCTFAFYLLKQNLYGTGKKVPLVTPWRDHCEYEALCEGDDYWTHPEKLQKQVEYLDEHPDCSCCVHEYKEWEEEKGMYRSHVISYLENFQGEGLCFDVEEYAKLQFFTKTLTAMYRVSTLRMSKYSQYKPNFDMVMFYALATQGYIYLMNTTMGVYRIQPGGICSAKDNSPFRKSTNPYMYTICKCENTDSSRKFVFNYLKDFCFTFFKHPCTYNLIPTIYHLGWKWGRHFMAYPFHVLWGDFYNAFIKR